MRFHLRRLLLNPRVRICWVALVALIGVQGTFVVVQEYLATRTAQSIQAVLRREVEAADPYLVAQTLNDLQAIGNLRCIRLSRDKSGAAPFLDLSYAGGCSPKRWLLEGTARAVQLEAINGKPWQVEFTVEAGSLFHLALWIARLLVILAVLLTFVISRRWLRLVRERDELENRSLREMSLLAQQVAHDIRSPVGALKVLLAGAEGLDPDERELLSSAVGRITGIAEDLLDRSRTSREAAWVPVSRLLHIIERSVAAKRVEFGVHSGLSIEFKAACGAADSQQVRSDPLILDRIISNLVNNAAQASQFSGPIAVTSGISDGAFVVEVRDWGRGLTPEELKVIRAAPRSLGKKDGNGLGLRMAKDAVSLWAGDLSIEACSGAGCSVRLKLPLAVTT